MPCSPAKARLLLKE
ncbi:hypothetical protein, partial [Parasutterella excrementihominis]